jgi:hypothetical protein
MIATLTDAQKRNLSRQMLAFFEERADDFGNIEDVKPSRRLHRRTDLNAFLLLDQLLTNGNDSAILISAEHEQVWLSPKPWEVMLRASEEDLLDLIRCGVFYDEDNDSLSMYV